jgi:hypothetical protein
VAVQSLRVAAVPSPPRAAVNRVSAAPKRPWRAGLGAMLHTLFLRLATVRLPWFPRAPVALRVLLLRGAERSSRTTLGVLRPL